MPIEIPIETGEKYNSLTIIKEVSPTYSKKGFKQRRVECKCDCGKIKEFYFSNIRHGSSTSCGCVRDKKVRNSTQKYPNEYFLNKKFGKLIVIGISEPEKTKKNKKFYCVKKFICLCECGNITKVIPTSLIKGNTNSCGCYRREMLSLNKIKHGDTRKDSEFYWLYTTWNGMMNRCNNNNTPNYERYGGRGIKIYNEWHDYLNFKEWILNNLGNRPYGCSLDRINNDGNYQPNNLRWATTKEQNKNKRKKYNKIQ